MTWSRFDDAAPTHPKARKAGNEAWPLWVGAVMYCNRYLTDGHVTLSALATECLPIPISEAKAKKLADKLVAARLRPGGHGLLEPLDDGAYIVHDFLEWNPSKAEVEAKRKRDRDRKRIRADGDTDSGNFPRGIRTESAEPSGGASPAPAPARVSRPARPADPIPPADGDAGGGFDSDPGRETPCPLNLVEQAEKFAVLTELAEKLPAPLEAVRAEADEFVKYWTVGGGSGRRRTAWMSKLRQRIVVRHGEGLLGGARRGTPPPETVADDPEREKRVAAARQRAQERERQLAEAARAKLLAEPSEGDVAAAQAAAMGKPGGMWRP